MYSPKVAIIGGGPAGLMAADVLSNAGITATLYDAMPSVGRKFLMAGVGGMNISNAEPFEQFIRRYGVRQTEIQAILQQFPPDALWDWLRELGINTFVGSSGRIFPTDMRAAPLLRRWLHRLRIAGVNIQVRHRWLGWSATQTNVLRFATPTGIAELQADVLLLALGGGSWGKLGSTGAWTTILSNCNVPVAPLQPSNCGFECPWDEHFISRFAGHPLKSVRVTFTDASGAFFRQQGEMIVTATGLEGGLIYALSAPLRETIAKQGSATLHLDLLPQQTQSTLTQKLTRPKGKLSFANHLRKCLGLVGAKAGLLRAVLTAEELEDPVRLATYLKALPITLIAPRPLDEAISSAGGVTFEALDEHLMLRNQPGVFCAGEMLDWEAPTGGYLLTACFASGWVAGKGMLRWLQHGNA